MKSELEIKEEIKITRNRMKKIREEYDNKKIPYDAFKFIIDECITTINTLEWCLGKNDRYD